MSFKDLLKASLESDMNEEMHDLVEEGFDAEGALMMEHPSDGDIEQIDEELDALTLAESMEAVADTIQYVLAKNEQNSSTAAMISMSVDRLCSQQGLSSPMTSMESYTDLTTFHKESMEGLRETAAKIRERVSESVNNRLDNLLYRFKNEENKIVQAQGRLEKALSSYKAKKSSIPGELVVKFDSLGRFMVTDKGVVKDLYKAIEDDFRITEYLIHEYSKNHVASFSKLSGIVRNASLTSDKAIDDIVSKVRAIKHPAKQIPTKYTSGYPLLGRAGLSVETAKGNSKDHVLGEIAEFYSTEIRKDPKGSKENAKEIAKDFAIVMVLGTAGSLHAQSNYDQKYSTIVKGTDLDRIVGSMKKHLSKLKEARKAITELVDSQKKTIEALASMKPSENVSRDKVAKLAYLGRCSEMLLRNGYKAAEAGLGHALYVVGAITYILENTVRRAN